jgi:hypothetical protein
VAIAVAVAAAMATSAAVAVAAGSAAASVTLPDMQIQVPVNDISIGATDGVRMLRYTHITWDAGTGPFELDPSYDSSTNTATFTQAIYNSPSPGVWQLDHSVPVNVPPGIYDSGLQKYQFPLASFTLNQANSDGTPGTVVAASPKAEFCMTGDTFVGGVPNTPDTTYIPVVNCAKDDQPLGWSVGWGDQYDQTDNGQPIDLTGVPDGTYVLVATVDPQHVLTESDPANNTVWTRLQLTGTTVTVLGQGPGQNPPPSPSPSPTPPTPSPSPTVMTCFVQQADVSVHGNGTVTTPSFHTATPGETLLAFVTADGPGGAGAQSAAVSGAGLTWKLVKRENDRPGDAEVWTAAAPAVLDGATVTSALSAGGYDQDLTVVAYEGVTGVGAAAAAAAASGAPAVTLTTTGASSLVFATGHDFDNATARALPTGQVMLDQWLDTNTGDTSWTQYTNQAVSPAGTTITMSDTAPATDQWDLVAVELVGDSG